MLAEGASVEAALLMDVTLSGGVCHEQICFLFAFRGIKEVCRP